MPSLSDALIAPAAHPSLGRVDLFGRFIGTWQVQNRFRTTEDGEWIHSERTWIFSRIAAGLAVQDVIIGSDRADVPVTAGTTVRAYDPALDAWRIEWFGTMHGNFCSLIARPDGEDAIRQVGVEHTPTGDVPIRWDFTRIAPDAFEWDGSTSPDGGRTWWAEQHMDAVRLS